MIQSISKLHKYPNIVKSIRSLCSIQQDNPVNQKSNFVTVYKFPYIRPLAIINRLKLYHTIVTGVAVPCSLVLNLLNYIDVQTVQVVATLGASGCISLYGLGYLSMKFIGFIYYDEEREIVKISYVDFWGQRKDIEIPASDIVPIGELPLSLTDGLYLKFRRYSTKDILKYNVKFGEVLDIKKIKQIF